jgi:hypothetical protein
VLAVPVVLIVALVLLMRPSRDVVARVPSPDGLVDAVLIETNGGATTSFSYEVHLAKHGSGRLGPRVASLYGAVRSEHAYGVDLQWQSADSLFACFMRARSAAIEHPAVEFDHRLVHTAFREGVVDSTAPPGGMLDKESERR